MHVQYHSYVYNNNYYTVLRSIVICCTLLQVIKSCWMDFAKVDKTKNIDIETLEMLFSKGETSKKTLTTKHSEL